NDVRPSTLPAAALKPTFSGPQHLLTLASVEDDGLGEELQVIWEIEPGARVIEKVALPEPTGFDPPDKLDAFLDAERWNGAGHATLTRLLVRRTSLASWTTKTRKRMKTAVCHWPPKGARHSVTSA